MIAELRKLKPFIEFGFGMTEASAVVGQELTVWLSTIFNQDAYTFSLTTSGATRTKISDYEYRISYEEPGTYEIQMKVATGKSTKKGFTLSSNIITVTVT